MKEGNATDGEHADRGAGGCRQVQIAAGDRLSSGESVGSCEQRNLGGVQIESDVASRATAGKGGAGCNSGDGTRAGEGLAGSKIDRAVGVEKEASLRRTGAAHRGEQVQGTSGGSGVIPLRRG